LEVVHVSTSAEVAEFESVSVRGFGGKDGDVSQYVIPPLARDAISYVRCGSSADDPQFP
jgi:hypothetical protein